MKNYVISLKTAIERREHIIKEFGKQDIAFQFFDAITPENMVKIAHQMGFSNIIDSNLSDGEKACFLSHLALWQKMIDDKLDYIAIFEDDVYLGENADLFLMDDKWAENYALIKLEAFNLIRILDKEALTIKDGRVLKKLKEAHLGAAGYIISKKTAELLFNTLKKERQLIPLDELIFEKYSQVYRLYSVYQLVPALCIQSDRLILIKPAQKTFDSQISPERLLHRKKHKEQQKQNKSFYQKFVREVKRILAKCHRFILADNCKIDFR